MRGLPYNLVPAVLADEDGSALTPESPAVIVADKNGDIIVANTRAVELVGAAPVAGSTGVLGWLDGIIDASRLGSLIGDARVAAGRSFEHIMSLPRGDIVVRCAAPVPDLVTVVIVDARHASTPPSSNTHPTTDDGVHPMFLFDRASLRPFAANQPARVRFPVDVALAALVQPDDRRQLVLHAAAVDIGEVSSSTYRSSEGPVEIGLLPAEHGGLAALVAVVIRTER